jgi:parallel beta-helix repeat protein
MLEKSTVMKVLGRSFLLGIFTCLSLLALAHLSSAQKVNAPSPQTRTPKRSTTPSGLIVKTSNFQGADVGARINAADKALGAKAGWIIVDKSGDISTQVHISAGHTLKFGKGRLPLLNPEGGRWRGVIMLEDNTSVIGEGEGQTILVEPSNAYTCIQSIGVTKSEQGYSGVGIISNIELSGFTIEGSNTKAEGGVSSTIELGNAHHVYIHDVKLKNTTCLGITAGGTGLTSKHAEDWLVENCLFEGVASQNLNVVNGVRITFRRNQFIGTGKICGNNQPCEGVTPIDIEPNSSMDAVKDVVIADNLIDSTNSPFSHGNGILVQNGVGIKDYGPVQVLNNRLIGGPLMQDYAGHIFGGIVLSGASNTTVADNVITRTAHNGIRVESGKNIIVERNKIVSTGTGGIPSFGVMSTVDSRFANNSVTVDPRSLVATAIIVESGSSDRNTFEGNIAPGGISLVGAHSRIVK